MNLTMGIFETTTFAPADSQARETAAEFVLNDSASDLLVISSVVSVGMAVTRVSTRDFMSPSVVDRPAESIDSTAAVLAAVNCSNVNVFFAVYPVADKLSLRTSKSGASLRMVVVRLGIAPAACEE